MSAAVNNLGTDHTEEDDKCTAIEIYVEGANGTFTFRGQLLLLVMNLMHCAALARFLSVRASTFL
jgi:hypothetical protein